jgi:predicted nucleotidyltransferase
MKKAEVYHRLRSFFSDKPISKVSILDQNIEEPDINLNQTLVLILEAEAPIQLSTLASYQQELEQVFGIKTDLGTESGLSPWILSLIKNDINTVLCK